MTAGKKRNRRGARGFTLLELLIAMSLLGLIFAALTGGLRFGTQAWRSTSQRLAQSDDLQMVYRTLRRQISTTLNAPGGLLSAQQEGSFEGSRDQLSFIGGAPARAMKPGLFQLKFVLVPDEVGQALALRWERLGDAPVRSDGENIEPLVRGLRTVHFSYFGIPERGVEAKWSDEWRDHENLPSLVRITFDFADTSRRPWPDLVIPISTNG